MGHISSAWFTFLGRGISLKFLMIADMTFTLLLLREMCAHRKTYMVPIQQDYFSTFFSSMFLVEIHHLIHTTPSSPERGKNLQNYKLFRKNFYRWALSSTWFKSNGMYYSHMSFRANIRSGIFFTLFSEIAEISRFENCRLVFQN